MGYLILMGLGAYLAIGLLVVFGLLVVEYYQYDDPDHDAGMAEEYALLFCFWPFVLCVGIAGYGFDACKLLAERIAKRIKRHKTKTQQKHIHKLNQKLGG